MKSFLIGLFLLFSLQSLAQEDALFVHVRLKTSKGDIRLKLYKKEAPRTVENFIGLVTGAKAYRDPKSGKKIKDTPFYHNLIFHKVHPELGIQTGCPWGTGKGWPGYTIKNESNELKFDKPFLVGMSRIPENENSMGSQFFITTKAVSHLNGEYTVFGEVVAGQDVVVAISNERRDAIMRPIKTVQLHDIVLD